MNEKVEQNEKSIKASNKKKEVTIKVNIPLWAYNLCWYISEEYKEDLEYNEAKLDELILQIYLTWPYYKRIHPVNKKFGD